ncbi:MAG: PH domain-containing protein [Legionella sp.]
MTQDKGDSNVVYSTKLHWIIFLTPVVSFIICLIIPVYVDFFKQPSFILAAVALAWIAMTWISYYFSSITILKKQVILRTGLLVRQTVDIPLSKIETIDIRQSIIGSLFHYGTLIITGTGGTKHFVTNLNNPLTCRRYIEQLMNDH